MLIKNHGLKDDGNVVRTMIMKMFVHNKHVKTTIHSVKNVSLYQTKLKDTHLKILYTYKILLVWQKGLEESEFHKHILQET